jgi:TRAP-type C4-dicarboxylate transport system substrate-binding protein
MRLSSKRSRSTYAALAVGALALSTVLSACGSTDDSADGPRTLTFGYHIGEKTSIGELWAWWMDEVEKRTDGSLTFDAFWDGTLVTGPDVVESLSDGRVDVATVIPSLYANKFPVTSVHELPFQSSNSPAVSEAMAEIVSDEASPIRAEFDDENLVPLAWAIGGSSALGTADPIDSVEDLRGLQIRGNDRSSKVLGAAGANIINMGTSDIYGSLDRGLLDGVFGIPFAFIGPLKFPEVVKNFTDTGMGVAAAVPLSVSQSTWDSLTDEQQQVIREVGAEIPGKIVEFDALYDSKSCAAVNEAGAKAHVLAPVEVDKLRAAGFDKVSAEWKAAATKAGADADAVLTSYGNAVKAAEPNYPEYQTGIASCVESS